MTYTEVLNLYQNAFNKESIMNKQAYFKMMGLEAMLKKAAEEDAEEGDKQSKKEQKKQKKQQHAKAENQASKSSRRRHGKWHSEALGSLTSPAVSGLGGGALGAIIGAILAGKAGEETKVQFKELTGQDMTAGKGALAGAITGAGAGLGLGGLADPIGGFSGAIAGPRTLAKQKKYNSSTGDTVANWLVPGAATFNLARTKATKDEQDAVLQELLLQQKLKAAGLA